MHISALTPDYTRVTSTYTEIFAGEGREAPAMFKHGDVFLMATSGCSGWEPNQLEVFWSRLACRDKNPPDLCLHFVMLSKWLVVKE